MFLIYFDSSVKLLEGTGHQSAVIKSVISRQYLVPNGLLYLLIKLGSALHYLIH